MCPSPKGSENCHHLQDACVGKGGSNPSVICILLVLAIDILRALSWAQPCPAVTVGSKAKSHLRQSETIYLFYTISNNSETSKQFAHILVDRERAGFLTSSHLDLSPGLYLSLNLEAAKESENHRPILLAICKRIAQQIVFHTSLKIQTWRRCSILTPSNHRLVPHLLGESGAGFWKQLGLQQKPLGSGVSQLGAGVRCPLPWRLFLPLQESRARWARAPAAAPRACARTGAPAWTCSSGASSASAPPASTSGPTARWPPGASPLSPSSPSRGCGSASTSPSPSCESCWGGVLGLAASRSSLGLFVRYWWPPKSCPWRSLPRFLTVIPTSRACYLKGLIFCPAVDVSLLLTLNLPCWSGRRDTMTTLATHHQPWAAAVLGWMLGLILLLSGPLASWSSAQLQNQSICAPCLGALFPSPVPPPVRGPGHVRPWLSAVWSFSGSWFGTTPTDPAPHLAPSGLHTQVLLFVSSQLPGSSLIPIPPAPTSTCWAVFFWALTFPLGVLR